MKEVRVRFAPSPTGPLHIGGLKTALYNYLFAKKHKGTFLLRIEDTDQNRFVEGAEQYIIESLKWCGIDPQEGVGYGGKFAPYKQSERKKIYKEFAEKLIKEGKAYYGFDSVEELNELRDIAQQNGDAFIYGIFNRDKLKNSLTLDKETVEKWIQEKPYVIRFKIPVNEMVVINDSIRGLISIDTNTLDDKIIFKSDGLPTYHLANVVDDYLMEISHVIRGEEWLPSTALHILLYNALSISIPIFAHLPLILKPEGKGKLSKRDGDKHGFPVFPLEWKDPQTGEISKGYREEGYLPNALINMLALLGWHPSDDKEIMSLEEISAQFSLESISKAGGKFSPEKIAWFNHQYIQLLTNEELANYFKQTLIKNQSIEQEDKIAEIIPLVKERIENLNTIWEQISYFFKTPIDFEEKAFSKVQKFDTASILKGLVDKIQTTESFLKQNIEDEIKNWIKDTGLENGKVMQTLRLALVGSLKGPDLFHIIEIIGKQESVKRINNLNSKFN